MPAAKPTTARKPPARAPTATAPLDFDVEVEEAALAAAVPELEPEPEPEPEPVELVEEEGGEPLAELDALAVAWNCANVLFAVGLTAKTMPVSQCLYHR